MRIGIDARLYGPKTGIGRYTQQLIAQLEKIDNQNEYVIFLRADDWRLYQPSTSNFSKQPVKPRYYSLAEQIAMPFYIKRARVELMHFTHFTVPLLYRQPFVVTIHDLILLDFPSARATKLSPWLYKLKCHGYLKTLRHAVNSACQIITVSEFTKNRLQTKLSVSDKKITVTYEAASNEMIDVNPPQPVKTSDAVDLARYGVKQPYLLYVGNAYPHKNLPRLIEAFKEVKKRLPKLQLVLVGQRDYFYDRLRREHTGVDGLVLTGFVPDKALTTFYQQASLYVFPSLTEGFGLPPLEAMSHGLPVAAAKAGSLPEVLGEAAAYFNPQDKNDIIKTITNLLVNDKKRLTLANLGKTQVKKYSWRRLATQTLQIYQQCGVKT